MGRKYTRVNLGHGVKQINNVLAFIDSGADLTIISTSLARRLGIEDPIYERSWVASDGDVRYSPIVEVRIEAEDDPEPIELDEVIMDDLPMD